MIVMIMMMMGIGSADAEAAFAVGLPAAEVAYLLVLGVVLPIDLQLGQVDEHLLKSGLRDLELRDQLVFQEGIVEQVESLRKHEILLRKLEAHLTLFREGLPSVILEGLANHLLDDLDLLQRIASESSPVPLPVPPF